MGKDKQWLVVVVELPDELASMVTRTSAEQRLSVAEYLVELARLDHLDLLQPEGPHGSPSVF